MREDGTGLDALVGAWRVRSFGLRWSDSGERTEIYGPNPDGYMVFEPSGRIMFVFGPRDRASPKSDDDRIALFSTFMAYTGRVRLEGSDCIITNVDYAWNPDFQVEQVRFFKLLGDRLEIRSPEQTHPSYGDRRFVADISWERDRI
jgi:hypothetical protein